MIKLLYTGKKVDTIGGGYERIWEKQMHKCAVSGGKMNILQICSMQQCSEMRRAVADYPLNLVEVVDSEKLQFSNPDVEQVFRLSRKIYQKQITPDEFQKVRADLAEMVGCIVKSEKIVTIARKSAGKEIDMCEALEEMMAEREELGKEIGKEMGQWRILTDLVVRKIRKNYTAEQTAEMLEADSAVIERIYDATQRFAPEYDVKAIVEALMREKV